MSQGYPPYDPMQQPMFDPYGGPPPRRSSAKWWIIGIVGAVGLCVVVCCGGGFVVMKFAMNMVTAEVEDALRDNPVVLDRIGQIQEFEMDMARSFAADGQDTFVFRVKGTKGEGTITAESVTNAQGNEEVHSGTLRLLPSGETVDLFPK